MSEAKELVLKISKLKKSLEKLQRYKGDIFVKLESIVREAGQVKKKLPPGLTDEKKVIQSLEKIDTNANEIEQLLDSSLVPGKKSQPRYYKIHLRNILHFGILEIESDELSLSVFFKGVLYDILFELVKKYAGDIEKNVSIEYRGFYNRKDLEKKLFGRYVGKNRLNSHLTRIRRILVENGLTDTSFIKNFDTYVRINIASNDVMIRTLNTD